MINHISIGVYDPEKVSNVIGELWNGYALPFLAAPNAWMVFADDGKGTAVEVSPVNTILIPGEGFPPEADFDITVPTESFEGKFVQSELSPQFVATHLAINTQRDETEIKAIARREGWRCITANRGHGLFQLIEFWVENRFLIEVFTPEMTARYVELMQPEMYANWLQLPLPPKPVVTNNLNLIG